LLNRPKRNSGKPKRKREDTQNPRGGPNNRRQSGQRKKFGFNRRNNNGNNPGGLKRRQFERPANRGKFRGGPRIAGNGPPASTGTIKCHNCGGLNHMASNCLMRKNDRRPFNKGKPAGKPPNNKFKKQAPQGKRSVN
jgi:hypothetical protein